MKKLRVVYYVNQFFGQEGGEEAASMGVSLYSGAYGTAKAFAKAYGKGCEVVATIICGDNCIAENLEKVGSEIIDLVKFYSPDAFIAGPAFTDGRYGIGCGYLCSEVIRQFNIPAITGMNQLNPGVELYRKQVYILKTGKNAISANKDVKRMAVFLKKLVNGKKLASPQEEGYFTRGYKRNVKMERRPAARAVDMVLDKYYGRPFNTEITLPRKNINARPAAIRDLSKATIVIATDGGLYPADNPDKMPSANADRFGVYDIDGLDSLKKGEWVIRHNGYDNSISNDDPNRLVPVDAMRKLEKEGVIGALHNKYLATTGLITTVENSTNTGKGITNYVKNNDIDAVLLTST
ncbi:MAG TPA: glycine/betaine/sarcosine/D-proline family reductase selenoprotein B [Clostridiaceae bacterium]|nr:glycine/betaine/sarcosine/D-proline family reductase selenoprotein B [Clostridiaceae bacterium]